MDRLLSRLERRFGKYAVEHLTWVIVGGMGLVFALSFVRPQIVPLLALDFDRVMHGQVWRLFTYMLIPPTDLDPIWSLVAVYWVWLMGTNLEQEWGAFKMNAFYVVGMIGTTIAAAIAHGAIGSFYLNISLTFAFATLFPDYTIRLWFVIPIKMKWLGFLAAAYLIRDIVVVDSWAVRASILAAVTNYFVFFGGHLLGILRGRKLMLEQAAKRESFRAPPLDTALGGDMGQRKCAICGALEADGADIRVCSCEKCGGQPRTLCLAHARNH